MKENEKKKANEKKKKVKEKRKWKKKANERKKKMKEKKANERKKHSEWVRLQWSAHTTYLRSHVRAISLKKADPVGPRAESYVSPSEKKRRAQKPEVSRRALKSQKVSNLSTSKW